MSENFVRQLKIILFGATRWDEDLAALSAKPGRKDEG
jgi:hypothetical protein